MPRKPIRRILPQIKDFKSFWKKQGPFKYALTSSEFPPILLEPEEWIFSDDIILLLKDLMQWDLRGISIVNAPFNRNKKATLKPESLIPWKIENFPQEWEGAGCNTFTPVGYLTESVAAIASDSVSLDDLGEVLLNSSTIESAFFKSLEADIDKIGYVLLKPEPMLESGDVAYIKDYLDEWQDDEDDSTLTPSRFSR
ncbi:MAG: hypothetical protein HQK68_10605 [Desulfamplus sp.]|nr:hypothetical protein [Desulfamplus sp.]